MSGSSFLVSAVMLYTRNEALDFCGLFYAEPVEWYDLDSDHAGEKTEALEYDTLAFTSPRNHEHIALRKDERMEGINLDRLGRRGSSWV